MKFAILILLVFPISIFSFVKAQNLPADSLSKPLVTYGEKGFEFRSLDNNYLLQIEWRGQFRIAYPFDNDPLDINDFENNRVYMNLNRARMKVGGYGFKPWMKYYLEYELASSNLLDFRLMIEKYPFFKIKVGQWKVQYNRERIISSGKQQTVERSIITRPFTIDRQQGISVFGHLKGSGVVDFNYWISTFMGTGRGSESNDDDKLMYMTRWQWNFMGRELKFSGSDLNNSDNFAGIITVAFVTNQSQFTRFSQDGGGQLDGFVDGLPGQYLINQTMFETAGMFKGFSWQQETHWKQINDNINNQTTTLVGNLIQLGYFPYSAWSAFPQPLELYTRHAFYIPNTKADNEFEEEYTLGLNWFISNHRNKLTIETSYIKNQKEVSGLKKGFRYRLQWDVSF